MLQNHSNCSELVKKLHPRAPDVRLIIFFWGGGGVDQLPIYLFHTRHLDRQICWCWNFNIRQFWWWGWAWQFLN